MTAPFLSQAGDDLLDRSSPTTIGGDADRKVMMLGPQPGQLGQHCRAT